MMKFDMMTMGKKARELGFANDTFENVCRHFDVPGLIQMDAMPSDKLVLI